MQINQKNQKEPIAIVGMSGRFPGVNTLEEFWKLLHNGEHTIGEITRWDINKYFNPDKTASDKTHQRHGAMFEKLDDFDPLFFNISPAEAAEMSPSQKLMLELTWECIENSTLPYDKLRGGKVGVYIGNIWSDFEHLRKHKHAEVSSHSAVGQSANIIANRVSYFFGFSGPSLVVDTGCSSSLVALHLACQSLWDGSISESIVGGVNHILDPDQNILLSKFGGLSAKGQCSTFDIEADGFVRGEGGGIVMLKRLIDAEKDNDHIYAVIRGSAINNNGYNENLPATSIKGQTEVLEEAYRSSGIAPHEIHYVEAHGTGTKLGDPTESRALGQFFSKERRQPLKVGSVKTNLGHLEGAAGMAGLIKTILAINKRQLPKNLNFKTPNPDIDFKGLQLEVQSENSGWPLQNGETLKAGVNSFGWGGTNGHVVIEEYKIKGQNESKASQTDYNNFMLPISAQSENALLDYAKAFKNHLEFNINGSINELNHVLAATALRKPSLGCRKLVAGDDKQSIIKQLKEFITTGEITNISIEKSKVVFIFPGQGSQWAGMGKELYLKEPVFKTIIDECEKAFAPFCEWSLIEQIHCEKTSSRLNEIDVIQPMLCAMQIALARLWESKGVIADAVTGHSMGEVAAAHISGSISLQEAAAVICTRSKLMKTVSGTGGAMAVTELTVAEAEEVTKAYPGLSVAVNNSPKSTVIAGQQPLIESLLSELDGKGKFCRQVKVDVASHSEQMEPLKQDLASALGHLKPVKNNIPLYSTVRNQAISGTNLTAEYWVENLRNGVQFAGVIEKLIKGEHNIFIEVSPHPVLTTSVQECLEAFGGRGVVSASLYRDKSETQEFYHNFDHLYQQGLSIDWDKIYRNPLPFINLPHYPFQRSAYSLTERNKTSLSHKEGHIWLGKEMPLAHLDNLHFWESKISLEEFPYLKDHAVSGVVVLPGVSYIEMVTAAIKEFNGTHKIELSELMFSNAVTFDSRDQAHVQLKLNDSTNKFTFYQYTEDKWTETASGTYAVSTDTFTTQEKGEFDFEPSLTKEDYYLQLATLGLNYGPYFQGIDRIKIKGGKITAVVQVPDHLTYDLHKYEFQPAVIDACLQTLFAAPQNIDESKLANTYLTALDKVEISTQAQLTHTLFVETTLGRQKAHRQSTDLSADISIYNNKGDMLMKLSGLQGKIFMMDKLEESEDHWYHQVQWVEGQYPEENKALKNILLLCPPSGVELMEKTYNILTKANHEVVKATVEQSMEKTLQGLALEQFQEIAFMPVCEFDEQQESIPSQLTYEFIQLLQCIANIKTTPRVVLVTNGTLPIKTNEINPALASAIGIARVAANELAEYNVQTIDLSYKINELESKQLARLLVYSAKDEREIAIRNGQIYFSRLNRFTPALHTAASFNSDGVHIVTGYKGIAFSLVEWMFTLGAFKFCLVSRSTTIDKDLQRRMDKLIARGASFELVACDIRDKNKLSKVLNRVDQQCTVKSIIHAAGVIAPQEIVKLTKNSLDAILDTKIQGAWNLHLLSQSLKLDQFILFSSASNILGLSGQASYVAANNFLDTLAHYREGQKQPALSVNWGVMSDVGMVANAKHLEKFAKAEGFVPTKMSEAVDALSRIINQAPTSIGVFKFKPGQTAEYFPSLGRSNYLKSLLADIDKADGVKDFSMSLRLLPHNEDRLLALETHLKDLTAQIIKTSADKLSAKMKFKSLGIDSLMAVQFRNRLEKELGIKLSVAEIWQHPTIAEYASFLLKKLFSNEPTMAANLPDRPTLIISNGGNYKNQLVCFHDAGGTAALYEHWEDKLPSSTEVIAVELPGRGQASNAKPFAEMKKAIPKITDMLISNLNKPFMFFGHSMGGLIAFEVVREMRRKKAYLPYQLVVSSTPQLSSYDKTQFLNLTEQELVQRFPYLSSEVMPDDELRHILTQILKKDLSLINSYSYAFEPPFDIDMVAIHGSNDDSVNKYQMLSWKNETTQKFHFIEREGDHHYLRSDSDFVVSFLSELINNKTSETVKQQ